MASKLGGHSLIRDPPLGKVGVLWPPVHPGSPPLTQSQKSIILVYSIVSVFWVLEQTYQQSLQVQVLHCVQVSSIFSKPPRATLTCRQILRRPVGHFQINVWNRLASQVRTLTGPTPCKNSSNLYQSQERPLAKVGWTCPPQSTPWRHPCL